jgi:hypothetical protein
MISLSFDSDSPGCKGAVSKVNMVKRIATCLPSRVLNLNKVPEVLRYDLSRRNAQASYHLRFGAMAQNISATHD